MSASVQKLVSRGVLPAGVATAVIRWSRSAPGSPRDHDRKTALQQIGSKPAPLLHNGIVLSNGRTSAQMRPVLTASRVLGRIMPGR